MKSKIFLSALVGTFLCSHVYGQVKCPDMTEWKGEEMIQDWKIKKGGEIAKQAREGKKFNLSGYHAWYILNPKKEPMHCIYLVKDEKNNKVGKVTYIYQKSAENLHLDETKAEVKCSARTSGWKCTPSTDAPVFPEACEFVTGVAKPCPPEAPKAPAIPKTPPTPNVPETHRK